MGDSLIAKFKEAGGTVQEIDVWAESPRLSPLWLSASSSACHGLLIMLLITVPTKPSATKMPRTEAGERGNYWHADASAWCCCARCKIHERVSVLKLKMMLCVMMLPLVVVGCTSKQSVSQCVKPPPSAWIMQPPPTADTAERDYFTLREADHYAKTTGRNQYINEQCR